MLKSFYDAVLPRSGSYALFLLDSKSHVWAPSIDSLLDHTEARAGHQGVYFATASYLKPDHRTQANVSLLRALRLDIDAGAKKYAKNPNGTYPTQQDALKDFISVSKDLKLAPSYIISSGEGLHIYYCFDEDLEPARWLPLASQLGKVCREHNLKVDGTVTTDTARILRPPGSLHNNGQRVSVLKATGKVYSPAEMAALLGDSTELIVPTRVYDLSVNEDVVSTVGPAKSLHKIIAHCPAMAEIAAVRGDVPEPHWRAMLGVVKFTVEGLDGAHEMSSGHDDYDPIETEKKFAAWATGPTSCKEFSRHTKACATCQYNGKIKSPVMLGLLTPEQTEELPSELQPPAPTPVVQAPTGDPWDGCLPPGCSVYPEKYTGRMALHGMIEIDKTTETGDVVKVTVSVPITYTIFWLTHWSETSFDGDKAQVVVRYWAVGGGGEAGTVKEFMLDQSLIAAPFELLKKLAENTIHLTSHKKAQVALTENLKAQLLRIQTLARRPKVPDRMGMRILPTGQLVCVHGRHVIYPDGRIMEALLGEMASPGADEFCISSMPPSDTGEWGSDVWDDYIRPAARMHADFLATHFGMPGVGKLRLAIMLGLSSPLMPFVEGSYSHGATLPPNGLSVALYSRDSARGKSAAVKAVMLAFGPVGRLVKGSDKDSATDAGRTAKLSRYGSMPHCMDEAGGMTEAAAAQVISAVANGESKTRGTQKGSSWTAPPWSLINMITTNRSQRDMIATARAESNAIQARLLELDVNAYPDFGPEAVARFKDDWAALQGSAQGALGAVLQYAAVRKGVADINTLVSRCVNKAAELLGGRQDARFQYMGLGALLATSILLEEEGLVVFDLKELVREFKSAHDAGAEFVRNNLLPTDGCALLQMALHDMMSRTLITEKETNRNVDRGSYDILLNQRVPESPVARHIISKGWTYLSVNALRTWCTEHKITDRDVLVNAQDGGALVLWDTAYPTVWVRQKDLYTGTKESSVSFTRCYKVDTHRLYALTGGADESLPANVLSFPTKPTPSAPPPKEIQA